MRVFPDRQIQKVCSNINFIGEGLITYKQLIVLNLKKTKSEIMNKYQLILLASGLAATTSLIAPYANAQSITNATQLKVDLAPITISGIKQGGSAAVSGNGLTTAAVAPVLDSAGVFAGATAAATTNSAFEYAVSGHSADTAATATTINTATPLPATTFGVQTGSFTGTIAGGAIAIDAAGAATATQATSVGATVSAVASTSLDNGFATTSFQRAGSATNAQSSFSASRQASSASLIGSGVTAATLPSLADAALGAATVVSTSGTATLPTAGAFTYNNTVVAGQAGANLVATGADVTIPAYGVVTTNFGGTTQAALGVFTVNGLTVNTANSTAGTSASLTTVGSFSVFTQFPK